MALTVPYRVLSYHWVSVATVDGNEKIVQATAGKRVFGLKVKNNVSTASAQRKVALHNLATQPDTGVTAVVYDTCLEPLQTSHIWFGEGLYFSNGISFTISCGAADNNTTQPGAGDVTVDLLYEQ